MAPLVSPPFVLGKALQEGKRGMGKKVASFDEEEGLFLAPLVASPLASGGMLPQGKKGKGKKASLGTPCVTLLLLACVPRVPVPLKRPHWWREGGREARGGGGKRGGPVVQCARAIEPLPPKWHLMLSAPAS